MQGADQVCSLLNGVRVSHQVSLQGIAGSVSVLDVTNTSTRQHKGGQKNLLSWEKKGTVYFVCLEAGTKVT